MANEPRAMREIHEICEKLYEETKNMPPGEHTERVNRQAEELAKQSGFKNVGIDRRDRKTRKRKRRLY